MRVEGLAVAAVMALCAGQAGAVTTITQSVFSSFQPHASSGSRPIGGLNLTSGQTILSATLSYSYESLVYQDFFSFDSTSPVTYTYNGTSGFAIYSLPIPFSAYTSSSGSVNCTAKSCDAVISGSGTTNVPLADLAAFATAMPLTFAALGNIQGSIDQNVLLMDGASGLYASGTMTYLISDPVALAVPEPATWATMILGMGAVGVALRRRRATTRVRFA